MAAVTVQVTPSMVTVFSDYVVENPVPVIVTLVPPAVVPLAGLIAEIVGVTAD